MFNTISIPERRLTRHDKGQKPRLPWKTKRILRRGPDWTRPSRMRRYRRLNRPSLRRQTGCQWYEIPVVDKIWRENAERAEREVMRLYGNVDYYTE